MSLNVDEVEQLGEENLVLLANAPNRWFQVHERRWRTLQDTKKAPSLIVYQNKRGAVGTPNWYVIPFAIVDGLCRPENLQVKHGKRRWVGRIKNHRLRIDGRDPVDVATYYGVPLPGQGASPLASSPRRLERILEFISRTGYVYSEALVRRFHAALHALDEKRFVLLTGLSGAGKTLLTRVYAHAHHGVQLGQENPYYCVIPVRPNWNTPRDLLGYYNPIIGRYETTPFLDLLLRAHADPEHAYFAVLDEMNLAPVEHYLSDVLSAMESGEAIPLWSAPSMATPRPHEDWNEDTGPGKEVVRKDLVIWALRNLGGEGSNDDIWSRIEDHPVHAGSTPRASMRRALQELRDAGLVEETDEESMWRLVEDAEAGQAPRELVLPSNVFLIGTVNVDETTHGFSDKVLDRAFTIELWDVDWDAYERIIDVDLRATGAWVLPVIRDLHRVLAEQHLDFGYRTAYEVLRYVRCYAGDDQDRAALDDAVKMKILPKVRGDSRVKAMLEALEAAVVRHLGEQAASLGVVRRMRTELQDHGSTRFWR